MKNSGSFAGLTLLAGLAVAASVSMLPNVTTDEPVIVSVVMSSPSDNLATPAPKIQLSSKAEAKKASQCVEAAQQRKARQRAAAYALIAHEGPVADGGDDAGFFSQRPQVAVPQAKPDTDCGGEQTI